MNHILSSRQGATLILRLNRPKSLNALNTALLTELDQAVSDFIKDEQLRGLILTEKEKRPLPPERIYKSLVTWIGKKAWP